MEEEKKEIISLQLCFICRKESTGILLQNRNMNKPKLNPKTIGLEVCDKCKKKYLNKGVLLIGYKLKDKNYISGNFAVIKDRAFKKIFNVEIPKGKIAFCEEEVLNRIHEGSQRK